MKHTEDGEEVPGHHLCPAELGNVLLCYLSCTGMVLLLCKSTMTKSNLQKEESILAYDSKGIRAPHGKKA